MHSHSGYKVSYIELHELLLLNTYIHCIFKCYYTEHSSASHGNGNSIVF